MGKQIDNKKVNNTPIKLSISPHSHGINKAKTHKGRKILEAKAPKIFENPKTSIFIKGNKSSEVINMLLKELHLLRGDERSKLFLKKQHNIHPFDD